MRGSSNEAEILASDRLDHHPRLKLGFSPYLLPTSGGPNNASGGLMPDDAYPRRTSNMRCNSRDWYIPTPHMHVCLRLNIYSIYYPHHLRTIIQKKVPFVYFPNNDRGDGAVVKRLENITLPDGSTKVRGLNPPPLTSFNALIKHNF
jgi:hypothetical protein